MPKNFLSISCLFLALSFGMSTCSVAAEQKTAVRRLPVKVFRDKMKAGWIGQIAGVSWGAPTEFRFLERIIPESDMPVWKPEMINDAFGQDDLYVEMTFLRTMQEHGLDVSLRQAGIDFANSGYELWHANKEGRSNLRSGIAPLDSSHPKFNKHADDIDYQIEADFSGLIAPGMPNVAVELGDKFGRLVNYGDGVYAGMFVGAMYSEAFFEDDVVKIVKTALEAIPADCQYAEMVRDLLKWYEEEPNDWEKTWAKIEAKYQKNPEYRRFACDHRAFNIDAKINGAYILMGLLYGKGDLDKTIIISTRCGQDSDCNPSNAAGVLFTTIGFSKLPARFSEKLDETGVFSHTAYNFPALIDVCEQLARQAVAKEGGSIEKNAEGEDVFVIPVKKAKLGPTMKSWEPGPIANSLFSEEEKKQIRFPELRFETLQDAISHYFPGWTLVDCGPDMEPGMLTEYRGKKNVLLTHPLKQGVPCRLVREVQIPAGKKAELDLSVSHYEAGDWDLIVKINGSEVKKESIDKTTVGKDGWLDLSIDLSKYAGQKVKIELLNQPSGWLCEAGYWAKIDLKVVR